MTERDAMTLEQVRTRLRDLVRQAPDEMDSVIVPIRELIGFAHAIDAHLSRAAEPLAWGLAEDVECLEENKRDPESVDAIECLLWKEQAYKNLRAVFTHPPKPARGTRDAEIAHLREVLGDLLSWFPAKPSSPEWRIEAGDHGADEAVEAARAAMAQDGE